MSASAEIICVGEREIKGTRARPFDGGVPSRLAFATSASLSANCRCCACSCARCLAASADTRCSSSCRTRSSLFMHLSSVSRSEKDFRKNMYPGPAGKRSRGRGRDPREGSSSAKSARPQGAPQNRRHPPRRFAVTALPNAHYKKKISGSGRARHRGRRAARRGRRSLLAAPRGAQSGHQPSSRPASPLTHSVATLHLVKRLKPKMAAMAPTCRPSSSLSAATAPAARCFSSSTWHACLLSAGARIFFFHGSEIADGFWPDPKPGDASRWGTSTRHCPVGFGG